MLTVIGANSSASGALTADRYVPLSFHAGDAVRANPITWRYTDDAAGLLEFKIDRMSGEIYGVTLVSSRQPIEDYDELPCDLFDCAPGLPTVNAQAVRGTVFEEWVTVRLARRDHSICALWGDWGSSTTCLSVDRTRFLLRDDELVGVCFGPLTELEMSSVENWNRKRTKGT